MKGSKTGAQGGSPIRQAGRDEEDLDFRTFLDPVEDHNASIDDLSSPIWQASAHFWEKCEPFTIPAQS